MLMLTTVQALATLLAERGISGAPVVDASGRLVGIVSEGDLLHRAEIGPLEVGDRAGYRVQTLERLNSPGSGEAQHQCRGWSNLVRHEVCDQLTQRGDGSRSRGTRQDRGGGNRRSPGRKG
jgi:hypothetical protein